MLETTTPEMMDAMPTTARPPPTGVRQSRPPWGCGAVVMGAGLGAGGLRLGGLGGVGGLGLVACPSGGWGPSLWGRSGVIGTALAVSLASGTVRMKRWRAEMDQSLGVLPMRS